MTVKLRAVFLLLSLASACHPDRPPGWSEESHGRGARAAYDYLFEDGKVHRFDIFIDPQDHLAMQQDLQKYSSAPQGPLTLADPIWVPVAVELDGVRWLHVGMRYKGNSSLKTALAEGIKKLAFRLDFDKFEDEYPSIHDQRFWGFEEMTFSNAFKDPSLIRDKLAADIFRRGQVPAARGAFARVFVDFGEGPVYFGLYTMIEDPGDRMLDVRFGAGGGNLYKPEPMQGPNSGGASWSSFVAADFDKQNNKGSGYEDVQAAIAALNADRSNAESWRKGLEAVFDVRGFLRWLAINQLMENWDSYPCIPHNYYLYADPRRGGRLVWIPWDLNEAMLHRSGHCTPPEMAWSLLLDEADRRRPLIRFLLDDEVYRQWYLNELRAALDGAFELNWVQQKADEYHALIAPYVAGEEGESAPYTFLNDAVEFENSLDGPADTPLKLHVKARHDLASQVLGR